MISTVLYLALLQAQLATLRSQVDTLVQEKSEAVSTTLSPAALHDVAEFYGGKYNVEPSVIEKVIQCESGGKTDVYGDRGKAYGPLQWWEQTFDRYREDADMEHFEYRNTLHQVELFSWALKNGRQKAWTCWTKLYDK